MSSVLIVEGDNLSRSATTSFLHSAGFGTVEASDCSKAIELMDSMLPIAALVDYELPDGSGLDLFTSIKKNRYNQDIPVIMLGPCCNEVARIQSLEKGADDVVSKPISPGELVLRLKNIMRRHGNTNGKSVSNDVYLNGITMDMESLQVTVDGENADLSLSEFRLLYHFMRNPNKAFSRIELCSLTKGDDAKLDERSIDVYVMRLRKSLQQYGHENLIQTVRGVGYRFAH